MLGVGVCSGGHSEHHRPGGSSQRHIFPHRQKPQLKVLAWLAPERGGLPGVWPAGISPCSHGPLAVCAEAERAHSQVSLPTRSLIPSD